MVFTGRPTVIVLTANMEKNGLDTTYGKVDPKLLEGVTELQKNAILNWVAYVQFEEAMGKIKANMKEIPILPSEIPPSDDTHTITKVELPPEGGVLTFMSHFQHPFRGFPHTDFVSTIEIIKKLTKGMLSGLYHSFRNNKPKILLVLPSAFIFRELIHTWVYTFYRLTERHKIKPYRYSQPIRELHRAFTKPREMEDLETLDLRLMLRDIACMILEFDNAYRFRFQDLLSGLNKDSLRKNPIKELNRLADVASGRETTQQVKDTWKLIKMFNSYYLRFDGRLKRMVTDILLNISLEEIKLTPEDVEYCLPRKDYVFGSIIKC